jgi:rubredoxin
MNIITIKINFRGGIISPGDLYNILVAAGRAKVEAVSFGLRQQLLIDVLPEHYRILAEELHLIGTFFEANKDNYPNITSSYPAEEIFITSTWLSEGVYKDIFDMMEPKPRLKINISDSNQSFTPILTGNINWVASLHAPHFWHLFIRFPKTNTVYEWKQLAYTNDVARISKQVEALVFEHPDQFYDNPNASGDALFSLLGNQHYNTKPADAPAKLPAFNLPYNEGLNRYQDKFWLGIYRRDELYPMDFLKDLCRLCLRTKIGQICSTPWKTIIVKNIEEKDRVSWNNLLASHQINVRHAANELNFQVEDNCKEGLALKSYLVKHLHNDDTRTFGICVGIKTRRKSEVFSSILVRKRPLLKLGQLELFNVYDILCAKDFNPNERTGFVFSKNNFKFLLPEQLRRAILSFSNFRNSHGAMPVRKVSPIKEKPAAPDNDKFLFQCRHCLSVYDETVGEPAQEIAAGTAFQSLPAGFACPLCDSGKEDFIKIHEGELVGERSG